MTTPPVEYVPIAEGLFAGSLTTPRLLGSRCEVCGETTFPAQKGCPSCTSQQCEEIPLSSRGILWTWTIQHFPPPPPYLGDPKNFSPFGVGYVELAEGVRVESRLTESDPRLLSIGMEMELTLEPFGTDDQGREIVTFAFKPVTGSS